MNRRDLSAGFLFIGIGAFFGINSVLNLQIGSAFRMGPGYIPILLSVVLAGLGAIVILQSFGEIDPGLGTIPWRGMSFITIAPVMFGLTVVGLGILPAIALASLLASWASARMGLVRAIILSALLTAFCVLIFSYGLGLPIALIGPWLNR